MTTPARQPTRLSRRVVLVIHLFTVGNVLGITMAALATGSCPWPIADIAYVAGVIAIATIPRLRGNS